MSHRSLRSRDIRRTVNVATVVGAGFLLAALRYGPAAEAQAVYKWVDAAGVVHFSDVPPGGGQKFEERGAPSDEPGAAPSASDAPRGASAAAAPAAEPAPEVTKGPPRIILTAQQALPHGADARHLIGSVKNVGGRAAARVAVTAHISDAQGQECAREEIEVVPSALEAGESGNFDVTVQSPCLADGGSVDPEPHWD